MRATHEQKKETLACLVIDDPLLKPKYGCLDYQKLLDAMKAHNFFTEIAFIPWNYKRSDPRTVKLFANNPEYYALCVHGCNHSASEFGGNDYKELSSLASTALWRMDQHKKLTGLSYDPVMVFPQGRFSSTAMKAVKDRGYLAACNTTIRATDASAPAAAEYRFPATTMYHDFPLFYRRYPKDRELFIDDIESGRPIIVVEHHTAFRDGYKEMSDLVDWINQLGQIRWTSLLNIATHYAADNAVLSEPVGVYPSHRQWSPAVIARRFLSEARDNYVQTSSVLNRAYKLMRR